MKIRTLAATAALALPVTLLTATPAEAAGVHIYHYAPDAKYDPDILFRCGKTGHYLREGQSSKAFDNQKFHPDCNGVTAIYVKRGQEIWSLTGGKWVKRLDKNQWYWLSAGWSDGAGLTVRKD